ncbi:hypothetical protein SAMN05216482_9042 [Streptomyces sp. PAN_FS17]|nr:hypothetical protein SAMN05216482_9042 [Streptomyces sp. PAN_FS17]
MLGGALAAHVPAAALTAAFAVAPAAAALRMLRAHPHADIVDSVQPARAAVAGAGLGAVTGVLGVGGGFLAVPGAGRGARNADA